jgi:hypothetical protein
MTNKAQAVLQKVKRREGNRASGLFGDPKARERVLDEFNRDNLDGVGRVGEAEQGMRILSEMNSLVDDHDEFVKSLARGL